MKRKVFIVMDSDELDRLVAEHWNLEYGGWEFVDQMWNVMNDSCYDMGEYKRGAEITHSDDIIDMSLNEVIQVLVNNGELPAGNVLIQVCGEGLTDGPYGPYGPEGPCGIVW